MKRLNASHMIGMMAMLVVPCLLTGCDKDKSKEPPGGYPGIVKNPDGSVTNNVPGYNSHGPNGVNPNAAKQGSVPTSPGH